MEAFKLAAQLTERSGSFTNLYMNEFSYLFCLKWYRETCISTYLNNNNVERISTRGFESKFVVKLFQ